MSKVALRLLDGFDAAVDGEPVPDTAWRLKKARELVKLLAITPGNRLHREQAMDELWRDRAPDSAANNLHQAIYVARRALDPGVIEVSDAMLELHADLDIDQFEGAAADARGAGSAAAYRAALALYPGDLLPENRYDDWAAGRRDELAELASDLESELAALDVDGADRLPPLPADPGTFIGRARELAELQALLGRTRLLTLAGPGGVGKTRLGLELARDAQTGYPSGAALVELAAVTDARLVPDAVAAALDVRALPGEELTEAVVDFLAERSMLLVLDNCEHLLAMTAALADTFLRSAPELTIIATSREPLHVSGEVLFRVPSLDIPDPDQHLEPRELLSYESVRLFVERAAAAAPGFMLDAGNAVDVARICLRLDGLPLALELAAGRVAALGPAAIAERLGDRFRVLRSSSHASPTRQQTLAATLQWSYDLLAPDERKLFARLAAFAGGFELEAVETVCAGGDLDAPDVADLLGRLVDKSLVTADEPSSRARRYRLLETVRLYARERLDESGEASALAERHARWALALAEAERDSPRLDREAANVRQALDTLVERAPDDALRFCVALWPFWLRRIDLHEARQRFDAALAAAPSRTALRAEALLAAAAVDYRSGALAHGLEHAEDSYAVASEIGDARAEWRALQFLGELGIARDATGVAIPWFERALELARREGFPAQAAIGIYSIGVAYWIIGDLARAEELVDRSVALLRPLADSPERIPSPVNIAELRMSQRRGLSGVSLVFADTLQPFVEMTCDAAASHALANQAGIVRERGDLGRAHAMLDESAARFAASSDEAGKAAVLIRRAYLELAEDDLPAARAALEQALELRRRQHDRRGVGLALAGLGLIATTGGDYRRAERHLAEAREIFRRAGDRWGLASTLWRTADLAFAEENLEAAEAALQEARSVLGATQRERWIAHTLVGLAELAAIRGDADRASALLTDARERYAERDDGIGVADVDERLRAFTKAR